jgi:hypothetical protein
MWKEYAIEPACLVQSSESFRFLFSLFGSEQGRWIAKFPSKWKEQVKSALETSPLRPIERSRVVEWLSVDKGRFFSAGPETYDAQADWLTNAVRHHGTRSFAKILATTNPPPTHPDVVVPMDVENLSESLACPHQVAVPRTAEAIVESIAPLLNKAQELLLIDPNFGKEARFLDVLQAILQAVARRQQKPQRIEYHIRSISLSEFRQSLEGQIQRLLPPGTAITFVAWSERPNGEKLHDRFVLAPIGGVNVSVGLDTGEPGQTTLVTRLTATAHEKVWAAYQHGKPTADFDLAHGFPIKLSRP